MNHNPSDDSAKVPPSAQAVVVGTASVIEPSESYHLNPSLQQALGCLDLKLEDELMRFRAKEDRAQAIESVPGNRVWGQSGFEAKSEILTAIIVEPAMSGTIVEEQPERGLNSHRSVTGTSESAPTGFIIIDGLSTSSTNRHQASANVNYAPIALYRDVLPEHLDLNFSSAGEIAPFHDEYLSSSQELLHQIQLGYAQPAVRVDNHPPSGLPTPKPKNLTALKIGSVAAACLLAGGAVYTYLNPSLLAPLTATKVVTTTTTNSLGQLIQSPNLAANEFTELTLSTLNTVKLPTTTTNVKMATTSTMTATTPGLSTTPVAIPFNAAAQVISPTTVITSQPKLADSLVKSLLPPNFQSFARQSSRTTLPGVKR